MASTQVLSSPSLPSPPLSSPIKLSNEFSMDICFQFHSELYFIWSCFYLNNKEIIYENFKLYILIQRILSWFSFTTVLFNVSCHFSPTFSHFYDIALSLPVLAAVLSPLLSYLSSPSLPCPLSPPHPPRFSFSVRIFKG